MPAGILSGNSISWGEENIKQNNFSEAQNNLSQADFWIGNTFSSAILLYLVLFILIIFGAYKFGIINSLLNKQEMPEPHKPVHKFEHKPHITSNETTHHVTHTKHPIHKKHED